MYREKHLQLSVPSILVALRNLLLLLRLEAHLSNMNASRKLAWFFTDTVARHTLRVATRPFLPVRHLLLLRASAIET